MYTQKLNGRFFLSDMAFLWYLALTTIIGHLLVSGNYGYFLDEFYTIACSKHLSFGFIDIPPVAPAILALNTKIFGLSLRAIHLLPALFSGLMVILVGFLAKQLGGGRLAVIFAGLAAVFVPVWMALGSLYTYDFLDQLMIVLLFGAVLLLIKTGNLKTWLLIGAIAGTGLMTKPSMVFFILGLILAFLITKHRQQFLTPWPWLGGAVAMLIILPSLVWQFQHGFPIAEYWGSYSANKTVDASPPQYLIMQFIVMNFTLLPIWITGLYYFLFHPAGKKYRLFGVAYLILLALFTVIRSNVTMLVPAYAMLLAGGAVRLELFFQQKRRKALQFLYVALIIIFGLIQAPIMMPVLPVDSLVKYYQGAGGVVGIKSVKYAHEVFVELPNFIYNRLEWDTLVNDVAAVYYSLPKNERLDTGILTQNYGWAGAIDLLGAKKGLPKTTCGQLNYYLFSLGDLKQKTWIIIGEGRESLEQAFEAVTLAKLIQTKYRLPRETPIFVCRRPKFTPEQARQAIKNFR
ncbi:MAG TPA: glycosyltransferase family 39 protein [Bacillota bacterium]|nr:glycosyltransferase family 39 protein [Bacillota bacterium]